ncbi:MAG: hypothetical protein D6805_10215 [Planctomycetota bacterium]|nr:MAG: hypothetical protein D6805_10215 [Planctomycetota bacterium]
MIASGGSNPPLSAPYSLFKNFKILLIKSVGKFRQISINPSPILKIFGVEFFEQNRPLRPKSFWKGGGRERPFLRKGSLYGSKVMEKGFLGERDFP